MKHIKLFENFKSPDNWKIGDIIVAVETKYADGSKWLHENFKYQIIEIAHANTTVKVREFNHPYDDEVILNRYFFKTSFITIEEWEFKQDVKKYNL